MAYQEAKKLDQQIWANKNKKEEEGKEEKHVSIEFRSPSTSTSIATQP